MKKGIVGWIIGSIVIVALIIGAIVFATQKSDTSTTAPDTTQPDSSSSNGTPSTPSEASDEVTITYTDAGFAPTTYAIKSGGTVTVENKSSRDLEFSSDRHPVHTAQPELNMDTLKPGEAGTFTVTKIGTWGFHDHLNASATGTLRVS